MKKYTIVNIGAGELLCVDKALIYLRERYNIKWTRKTLYTMVSRKRVIAEDRDRAKGKGRAGKLYFKVYQLDAYGNKKHGWRNRRNKPLKDMTFLDLNG